MLDNAFLKINLQKMIISVLYEFNQSRQESKSLYLVQANSSCIIPH